MAISQVYEVRRCVGCGHVFGQSIEETPSCPACGGYSDREAAYRIVSTACSPGCNTRGPHICMEVECVDPELA